MPKMKTSRAAAKRFKKTGTGKLVRNNQSAKTHSNSHASLKDRKLCNHISDSQFSQHNMYLRTCINSIFLFDIQII